RPAQAHPDLVEVRDIAPNTLVAVGRQRRGEAAHELQDPVEVVRARVIDGAAGDGLLRVPRPARMLETTHERLDIEHLPERTAVDGSLDGEIVGVEAAALVNGEGAPVRLRG